LAIGNPANEYILASLYIDRDDMANDYKKVKEVIDTFVLRLFSDAQAIFVTALNAMDDTKNVSAYHNAMFPIIDNHHITISRSFNIEKIPHYLLLIMFGAYENPATNVLTSIASGTSDFQDQYQLTTTNLPENDFVVVSISRAVGKMA
jgi:hypothetical protein